MAVLSVGIVLSGLPRNVHRPDTPYNIPALSGTGQPDAEYIPLKMHKRNKKDDAQKQIEA